MASTERLSTVCGTIGVGGVAGGGGAGAEIAGPRELAGEDHAARRRERDGREGEALGRHVVDAAAVRVAPQGVAACVELGHVDAIGVGRSGERAAAEIDAALED